MALAAEAIRAFARAIYWFHQGAEGKGKAANYPIQMTCIRHIISCQSYHIIISTYLVHRFIWSRRFVRPVLELVARALGDSSHLFDEPGVWGGSTMQSWETHTNISTWLCFWSIHSWNFVEHLKVGVVLSMTPNLLCTSKCLRWQAFVSPSLLVPSLLNPIRWKRELTSHRSRGWNQVRISDSKWYQMKSNDNDIK